MTMRFLCIAAFAAMTPALTAQLKMYSPLPFAHHDGITSTGYPIGYSSIKLMTYQQVHGDLPAIPLPIKQLAWRPRNTSASHPAYTANVTLTLGLGGPTPDNATNTYASNLGPSPVTVLSKQTINIGAFTQPGIAPAPYHYAFPFPAPFVYDGKGVLCWELRVHGHTHAATTLNFDLFQFLTAHQIKSGGRGCTASGKASPATLSGAYTAPSLSVTGTNLNDNLPTALLVGLSSTSIAGVPLPIALTGAPCALRNDIHLIVPGTVSGGSVNWQGNLGANAPNGTALFMQVLALDPQANQLGIVLTNGLAMIWPYTNRPVIRNWTTNNDAATTGSLQLTYGLVCEFGT